VDVALCRGGVVRREIANGNDDSMNDDLAERASLPEPGLQFLADPQVLAIGFPDLAQQSIHRPNSGRVPHYFASDLRLFCEEPPAGLHQSRDTFKNTLGVRELRA